MLSVQCYDGDGIKPPETQPLMVPDQEAAHAFKRLAVTWDRLATDMVIKDYACIMAGCLRNAAACQCTRDQLEGLLSLVQREEPPLKRLFTSDEKVRNLLKGLALDLSAASHHLQKMLK